MAKYTPMRCRLDPRPEPNDEIRVPVTIRGAQAAKLRLAGRLYRRDAKWVMQRLAEWAIPHLVLPAEGEYADLDDEWQKIQGRRDAVGEGMKRSWARRKGINTNGIEDIE